MEGSIILAVAVIVVVVLALTGRILLLVRRRRRTARWIVPHIVVSVLLAAATFATTAAFLAAIEWFSESLQLPEHGLGQRDPNALQFVMKIPDGTWAWACFQWMAYLGYWITVILALLLVGVWYFIRFGKSSPKGLWRYWLTASPKSWSGLFATVGKSALAMGCLCLLICLAVLPLMIPPVERQYQWKKLCLDPQAYRARVQEHVEQIEADPEAMESIHEYIEGQDEQWKAQREEEALREKERLLEEETGPEEETTEDSD